MIRWLLSLFRRPHEPRAVKLLAAPAPLVRTFADAVRTGDATFKGGGTCTHCGGQWNPAHDRHPHPRWARPIPMPTLRPQERLD